MENDGEGRLFLLYSVGISRNMSYLQAIGSDTTGFAAWKERGAEDRKIYCSIDTTLELVSTETGRCLKRILSPNGVSS